MRTYPEQYFQETMNIQHKPEQRLLPSIFLKMFRVSFQLVFIAQAIYAN